MEGTAFFSFLFPDATSLRLDSWRLDAAASLLTVQVTSTQTVVPCPVCTIPATRLHSRYTRTLADLPWAAYHVRLQLHARKWFCDNLHCRRRIFTERLPTVAAPWARCTTRLMERLCALGLALGGAAGTRLTLRLR